MILYFLRHGEAGFEAATDADRELTLKGEEAAIHIGLFCRRAKINFTHALVSPLTRAQQTARYVLENLPPVKVETSEHITPDANPRNFFEELQHFPDSSAILLVSHEPFCSTTISQLINNAGHSAIIMKTTSLACVEVHLPVGKGMGKLHWLISSDIARNVLAE